MVRGRKVNPDAPPSRQLEISRAFRQRRAQTLDSLREQIAQLQAENKHLRAENDCLRRPSITAKVEEGNGRTAFDTAHGGGESCMNCVYMRLEMDRMYAQMKQKEENAAQQHTTATASTSTTPTLCSAGASSSSPSISSSFKCLSSESEISTKRVFSDKRNDVEHQVETTKGCCDSRTSSSRSTAPSTMTTSSVRTEVTNGTPSSVPAGPLSYDHEAWEESVRANGGDPGQCCAGFFECDGQGKIIIPLPPSMQPHQQQSHQS